MCFKIFKISTCRYGTICIRENPGCLFIATNLDAVGHMTDLQEWPGLPFSFHSLILNFNDYLTFSPDNFFFVFQVQDVWLVP